DDTRSSRVYSRHWRHMTRSPSALALLLAVAPGCARSGDRRETPAPLELAAPVTRIDDGCDASEWISRRAPPTQPPCDMDQPRGSGRARDHEASRDGADLD